MCWLFKHAVLEETSIVFQVLDHPNFLKCLIFYHFMCIESMGISVFPYLAANYQTSRSGNSDFKHEIPSHGSYIYLSLIKEYGRDPSPAGRMTTQAMSP